jgi:hypothetical protein
MTLPGFASLPRPMRAERLRDRIMARKERYAPENKG